MRRVLVGFLFDGTASHVCAAALFALAKVFFAFVAAGVAAVVLGAHVAKGLKAMVSWRKEVVITGSEGRCQKCFGGAVVEMVVYLSRGE